MDETQAVHFAALARARHSTRAFLPRSVPRANIEEALRLARTAPSGANLQPGHFTTLQGDALEALKAALVQAAKSGPPEPCAYDYFPEPMPPLYKARQRETGYRLYEALGIERRDVKARRDQFLANYRFFDAPLGMVVSLDKDMGAGCFMDLGMSLQTLFLALQSMGLAACGIGALANYGSVAHRHLGLDEDQLVVCGIAIGYADEQAPVNQYRTKRADLADYSSFLGFED